MPDPMPQRGEIWWADFSPTRGHERRDHRPALVVSDDRFNESAAGLVLLCPLTTTERPGVPWHIEVGEEAGLPERSFVMCEQVRSASRQQLSDRAGVAPSTVMDEVEDRLRVLPIREKVRKSFTPIGVDRVQPRAGVGLREFIHVSVMAL